MFFGHKKYQKWGCHGQKSEFFSNAHIYSPRQDFLVSFIFSISGFVWLESRLLDFGGGSECRPLVCLALDALTKGTKSLRPCRCYRPLERLLSWSPNHGGLTKGTFYRRHIFILDFSMIEWLSQRRHFYAKPVLLKYVQKFPI